MNRILAAAASFLLIMTAGTAYSQTIPPYATGGETNTGPESIPMPIDRDKDLPGKPGCYVAEGGINGYYTSGKYYKQNVDSKLKKYAPWGIALNPSAEFFMLKMFAVGGTAEFSYEKQGSDTQLKIGVGPIFSLYITSFRTIIPYISLFGMYEHSNEYQSATKSMYWTDQVLKGGAKAGLIFMLSRQGGFFIDGRFTYESHQVATPPAVVQSKQTGWKAASYAGFKYFMF